MSGAHFNGSSSVGNLDLVSETGLDSDQLLLHCWINPNADGSNQYIIANNGANMRLWIVGANNRLRFDCEDSAGNSITILSPGTVLDENTGWTALDIVVDTTQGFANFYVNGVSQASGSPVAADIDFSEDNYFVGARTGSSEGFIGDIFQLALYNAFSSDYISATGELTAKYFVEMYDLDPDGVIYPKETSIAPVTGTQPLILLEDEYDSFGTNSGQEGDLVTTTGTPLPLTRTPPFGSWTFSA